MSAENETKKLAKLLVNHSIKVKPGELVRIRFYGTALPLVNELCNLISRKGAWAWPATINLSHEKLAPMKLLKKEFPLGKEIAHKIHAFITIDDREDLYALKKVDNKRINAVAVANLENNRYVINNKKWVIVRYPTHSFAHQSGMSYNEYCDYVFKTMNKNWNRERKKLEKLKKIMDKTDKVRIIGDKTDLTFSIKGRNSVSCYGLNNMPDGEVFTAPIKNSAEGSFFVPVAYYNSKKFENIQLIFKKGRVVNFNVKNNKKEFEKILNADKNARYLGELGIGKNSEIKQVVGDILFDEKKGGTIHLALGSAYEENFKKNERKKANKSAVHWDMIVKPKKLLFDNKEVRL